MVAPPAAQVPHAPAGGGEDFGGGLEAALLGDAGEAEGDRLADLAGEGVLVALEGAGDGGNDLVAGDDGGGVGAGGAEAFVADGVSAASGRSRCRGP